MRRYIDRVSKALIALAFLFAVLLGSQYHVGDIQILVALIMALFLVGAMLYLVATPFD